MTKIRKVGIPTGGSTGQVLTKTTATDFDTQWAAGGSGAGLQSGTASGTDTYTVTIGTVASYTAGDAYVVKFTNANTGASTININTLGAKSLTKSVSTALAGGDILAGQEFVIVYDGTRFQVIGISAGGGGSGDVVGPASATNGAVVLYDGATGKLIKNSAILPTTVGIAIANLTNPSAIRFIRINADNSVTARTAAEMLSDIGAQASGSYLTAANIVGTITNGVTTNAPSEDAVFDALALKAALASPTFTGTPAAPTAAVATNTTQIATTAFVKAEITAVNKYTLSTACFMQQLQF